MAAASSSSTRGDPLGLEDPEFRRNSSADSANEVWRISWPPITKSPGSGSGKSVEEGQLGHEARAIGQPAGHRRQAQRDRRADSSKRTD